MEAALLVHKSQAKGLHLKVGDVAQLDVPSSALFGVQELSMLCQEVTYHTVAWLPLEPGAPQVAQTALNMLPQSAATEAAEVTHQTYTQSEPRRQGPFLDWASTLGWLDRHIQEAIWLSLFCGGKVEFGPRSQDKLPFHTGKYMFLLSGSRVPRAWWWWWYTFSKAREQHL